MKTPLSDGPDNLMLVDLRRLDGKMDALASDMRDVKHRLTALEIQVGQLASTEASHYASTALRLDRIESRIDRLERHADILPAAP